MFRFLRVNMDTKECRFEDVPKEYEGLGGRGLTSAIVANEVDPGCNPIGAHNKLVFSPGLLGATNSPNTNRLSVGCKSPLTGGIKEANAGGQPGGHLAKLGILAIIVEKLARDGEWWDLEVTKDSARLVPSSVGGLNNYDAVDKLRKSYGDRCSYITIGRAGEFKLTAASIACTDKELRPSRHAGRGGVGAVMGSKGLKSIIVNPAGGSIAPIKDVEAFREASKRFARALAENPVTSQALPNYGSDVLVNIINEAGGLPTHNFEYGRFPEHEKVSGERMNEITTKRGGEGVVAHGCMSGCVIRCSGLYPAANGKLIGKWPEYETVWCFGPHSEIDDLDFIAKCDYLCDDYGVDTIDVGVAIGTAMAGGGIPWGDKEAVLEALHGISKGTPMGRVIGCGTATTGRVFGVRRVATVKGQSLPAYDPRAVKGQGVTYATTPMGADHTAGYAVTANILHCGGYVDPLKKEGQVELSRNLQIATASIDSVGLCLFTAFALLDVPDALPAVVDMLNAKFGWSLTGDDVTSLGKRILTMEVDFNRRAGITEAADRLPEFFEEEPVPPHNTTFDFTHEELLETLDFANKK